MLNTVFPTDFRWNRLQEPTRPSAKSADLMRLLSALDSGWKILGPVRILNCRDEHGGQVFCIDLYRPASVDLAELRELMLVRQESVERFLLEENITISFDKTATN